MWLLVAFEPLTSEHLLSAVRINAGRYNEMLLEPGTDVLSQQGIPRAPHIERITGDVDEELLLELCANLLTIGSATGKWSFAHASVLEYFEAHHFSALHAHAYVGFTSLIIIIDVAQPATAYRAFGPLQKSSLLGDDGNNWPADGGISSSYHSLFRHSLIKYAFGYWGDHVALVDKEVSTLKPVQGCTFERDAHIITEGLRILLQKFLGHPNNSTPEYRCWRNAFVYWVEVSRRNVLESNLRDTLFDIYNGQTTETYASFAAVHYGFFNMLSKWWQGSCDEHDRGTCPTCEACSWPNIDTTATSGMYGRSLLAIAAYFGHAHIVHALLSMGMDIKDGDNTSIWSPSTKPLCLASQQGFIEVCRVLVKYCQPGRPSEIDDALYLAARKDHHHIVRYLLSAGADPIHHIPKFRNHDTVLALAARKNNVEILRMVFEDNRDQPRAHLPSQSELVYAAIHAAHNLCLDALQCLVFDGHIDPNARYSGLPYETILLAAARDIRSWNSRVLRCLRECGVDFYIQEADLCRLRKSHQSRQNTVLEAVVLIGDVNLVQVAVEVWGEDVNAISDKGRYGCALIAAVQRGYLEVVQYLLKKNADANCQVPWARYRYSHTPLAAALRRSNIVLAGALIEHGADVNMPIKYGLYGNALVAAASQRTVDALKFAINAGARINAPVEYGSHGSALICATALGHVANVQYLLDHGADINYRATSGEFASALMAASYHRNEEMVSFLIVNGADVNRPENHGWEKMLKETAERNEPRNQTIPVMIKRSWE